MTGWKQVAGKWYYFCLAGEMAINTKIGGCEIGPDGAGQEKGAPRKTEQGRQ